MPFKFTMLFNFGGSGFSETWYYNSPVVFPLDEKNIFASLYASRYTLCNDSVVAVGWRLADVDNPRQTFSEVNPGLVAQNEDPDTVTNAWLAIVRGAGNIGRRQMWLRGIDDNWIIWNPGAKTFQPVGALNANFEKFKRQLKAGTFCIRTVQSIKAAGGGTPIVNLQPNIAGDAVTLGNAAAGLDAAKPLIVSGLKKPVSYLNGTYQASSGWQKAGGDVVIFGKSVSAINASGYVGGGRTRNANYGYTPVQDMTLEFARERRVGRAFFVPRGRRPKRA